MVVTLNGTSGRRRLPTHSCKTLDADVDRAASIVDGDMISVTVTDHDEEKRFTVDPGQAIHEAIAEAF